MLNSYINRSFEASIKWLHQRTCYINNDKSEENRTDMHPLDRVISKKINRMEMEKNSQDKLHNGLKE